MARVRLYLDHDVAISLVERLGAYTYDVIATRDVGNEELDDNAQLEYAARHERALVSHNRHHFGFSAIGPGRVYWFAPFLAPPGGETPADGLVEELARQYADFPDPIPEIIRRTPPEEIIRTDLYDLAPLRRWWRGRAVLVGDAAHAMTPNLGQGGAQAIGDAWVLAEQLARYGTFQEAFRGYQRLRQPRVRRMVNTAWWYGRLAHVRNRWLRKLRNRLLRATPERLRWKQIEWLYVPPN